MAKTEDQIKKNKKIKTVYLAIIRMVTVLLALAVQIVFMWMAANFLEEYHDKIYLVFELVGLVFVFAMVGDEEYNQKQWILIMALVPVTGLLLYMIWGNVSKNSSFNKRMRREEKEMLSQLGDSAPNVERYASQHPNKVQIPRYLYSNEFPLYENTKANYYPVGDDAEGKFLEDLRSAEKFIFLEYFIVLDGKWWREILSILTEKAAAGVDVRMIVDDFGSLFMNIPGMRKEMRAKGIKLCCFAPIHQRIPSLSFNFRDHRKITVVDGNVGYIGGVNLADEYINKEKRFGHWKDSMVRLEGMAVESLTAQFITMWSSCHKTTEKLEDFHCTTEIKAEGIVQPFSGGPHHNEDNPVEGAYLRMMNKARDYVFITTPYLVLDSRMRENLIQADRSGVDVRIIVPHIYDKWYVYQVNVYNYGKLLKNGVRIYEYTPGFIHAKNIVCDDECSICGSINLDFRSMYMHHENGVFFSDSHVVKEMKEDFLKTLEVSHEITLEEWKKRSPFRKFIQWLLHLAAPMM
ncbi:MAG: cardiolipin synthase [Lachnospiraceae bacterium]|nr:cardiolipin synthase [Lachnospiraceae bacterium]